MTQVQPSFSFFFLKKSGNHSMPVSFEEKHEHSSHLARVYLIFIFHFNCIFPPIRSFSLSKDDFGHPCGTARREHHCVYLCSHLWAVALQEVYLCGQKLNWGAPYTAGSCPSRSLKYIYAFFSQRILSSTLNSMGGFFFFFLFPQGNLTNLRPPL